MLSRRAVLCLSLLACGGWALKHERYAAALDLDEGRLQQTMQARHGASGVQALNQWLAMLRLGQGKPVSQQLSMVNEFWNRAVVQTDDSVLWLQADYWATPLQTLGKGAGDCEDYVVGKYFSLLRLGVPGEKLRLIYVRAHLGGNANVQGVNSSGIAHMVLGYYETPGAEPLVLDSLVDLLLPASQRKDLTPVFSFNAQGVYVAGAQPSSVERITRWRDLLVRMKQEGFLP